MDDQLREMLAKAREEVNSRPLSAFVPLEKSRGRLMYNCPVCGSGTGRNHTGALRLYPPEESRDGSWHVYCFANRCFGDKGTDTLGALRILYPNQTEWEILKRGSSPHFVSGDRAGHAEALGASGSSTHFVSGDRAGGAEALGASPHFVNGDRAGGAEALGTPPWEDDVKGDEEEIHNAQAEIAEGEGSKTPQTDASSLPKGEGAKPPKPPKIPIEGTEGEKYLRGRGLTEETLRESGIWYDPAHWFSRLGKRVPAVVIPYPGTSYWVARAIGEKAFDKPRSAEAGPEPLFHAAALSGDAPVFVVESQLCALSIGQAGGQAVALGNTGKARLMEQLERHRPRWPLILCLDNDPQTPGAAPEKGPRAQAELAEALEQADIPFLEVNIAGEAKDPNEALQADPDAFAARVKDASDQAVAWMAEREVLLRRQEQEAIEQARREAEAARLDYRGLNAAAMVPGLRGEVDRNREHPPIPTGFPGLDRLLDGGLYPGLYIVGAITSLGKTSFVLQMVDQIAAQGQDVLFFSLEMSRYELMAKSVSRLTYTLTRDRKDGRFCAKTTRGILSGKRYELYQPQELQTIRDAMRQYEQIGQHLWFIEGIGDVSTQMIRERVDHHIAMTGCRPVVVIDYLQILMPVDIRATDKQNTDRNVLAMKRLSRDRNIPVIGISSLNRENYLQPINLAAFKEAGSIEYGSDCLIGLQYEGMDYREAEGDKPREKRIREMMRDNENQARDGRAVQIQLKVLKNRNGARGASAPLFYTPMFNCFEELPAGFTSVSAGDPFSGAPSVKLRGGKARE